MDREIFEKLLNQQVQIINDEHFVIVGKIDAVFDEAIAVFVNGKTRYLSLDRILEVRPLE